MHEVRRVRRRRGGLPDDGVSHQRGGRREVAADRGEVERRHREHEALERPVLQPVPHARRGDRLLLVDARHVLDVEAPEVDQLAGGVDLGLVCRLRLAEHRRGVERLPPRAGEELGGTKQDRRALLPGRARPVLPRVGRSRDRALDLLRAALVRPSASTCERLCGSTASNVLPVRISSPPITSGISIGRDSISVRRTRSSSRSGLPGA